MRNKYIAVVIKMKYNKIKWEEKRLGNTVKWINKRETLVGFCNGHCYILRNPVMCKREVWGQKNFECNCWKKYLHIREYRFCLNVQKGHKKTKISQKIKHFNICWSSLLVIFYSHSSRLIYYKNKFSKLSFSLYPNSRFFQNFYAS